MRGERRGFQLGSRRRGVQLRSKQRGVQIRSTHGTRSGIQLRWTHEREVGILSPDNQRQHRTVSATLASISRMDSISTSYRNTQPAPDSAEMPWELWRTRQGCVSQLEGGGLGRSDSAKSGHNARNGDRQPFSTRSTTQGPSWVHFKSQCPRFHLDEFSS